ncbi:MAG: hypothetical protein AABY22_02445 [Nanoarchaeota archaeon]
MKLSIVPEIINLQKIKIFDEQNIAIILGESNFKFNNQFKNPFILIDNFEKEKYHKVEIKIISLEELEKLGYRLVSVSLVGTTIPRNYPAQKVCYCLENKNNLIPKSNILYKIPVNHLIEHDYENKRIRIKGRNAHGYFRTENAGKWIDLK